MKRPAKRYAASNELMRAEQPHPSACDCPPYLWGGYGGYHTPFVGGRLVYRCPHGGASFSW